MPATTPAQLWGRDVVHHAAAVMTRPSDPTAAVSFSHQPVMVAEVVDWFAPVPAGWIVDATLGGAGHARAVLDRHAHLSVFGIDRDPAAIAAASVRLAPYGSRAQVARGRFDDLVALAHPLTSSGRSVSGVLMDLGVSSVQLDQADRGFSYRNDAPLDMRMDPSTGMTAAELLAVAPLGELVRILRDFGDERFALRIAKAIVSSRESGRPILTTSELAQLVSTAIPAATRRSGGHPAKRSFQALRIAVNSELDILGPAVDAAIELIVPGGRLVVLAYHSGEDRIVKERLRFAETGGCTCPSGLPCTCRALPRGRALRRAVTRPGDSELTSNPRASSALARVFIKSADKSASTQGDHR